MGNQEHLARIAKEQGREELKKEKIEKIEREIEKAKESRKLSVLKPEKEKWNWYIMGLRKAIEILEGREK